jgi:hypothetical protein
MSMIQTEFNYASLPHSAPIKRLVKSKNGHETQTKSSYSVMNDPRVIRGNTHAAKVLSNNLRENIDSLREDTDNLRGNIDRSKHQRTIGSVKRMQTIHRSRTPPPVAGRFHIDIQTEDYLEELSDRPIEKNKETQTHLFVDRPPSPLFIPSKTGIDTSTQILDDELFDFDLEVEPMLEVLVGKTIETAMLEVLQEEEIQAILKQQNEFEMIRDVELAEIKRLEAESYRKHQEKERRIRQAQQHLEDKRELNEKVAAKKFANQILISIQKELFETLENEGYFYDPVKKEVNEVYWPELVSDFHKYISFKVEAEQFIATAFQNAINDIYNIQIEEMKRRQIKAVEEASEQAILEVELKMNVETEEMELFKKIQEEAEKSKQEQEKVDIEENDNNETQ